MTESYKKYTIALEIAHIKKIRGEPPYIAKRHENSKINKKNVAPPPLPNLGYASET